MLSVALYIGSIVCINAAFSALGANFLTNAIAGLVFILRDTAQRAIGHWVLLATVVSIVLSYLLSSPGIAVASAAAFAVSELVDWAVYTTTKRPWRDRMLLSSLVSTPIDSALFLWLAGFWSWQGVATLTAAKILVAGLVWFIPSIRRAA